MKLTLSAARRRTTRKAAVTLAAGLALVLTPLLNPVTVSAEEAEFTDPECLSAREAQRSATELFALGCGTLAEAYGALNDSSARNAPVDRIASKNMSLLANRPKTGEFANTETSNATLSRANSDLAFKGDFAFAGNFNGFQVWNIKNPSNPIPVTQLVCPGGQGDVSVYRNLLVFSVDSPRTDDTCESQASSTSSPTAWEGLRIFNIKNPRNPQYVGSVKTACGSHTHSLAPSQNGQTLFAYVSSYFPSETNPNCPPPHDKISVVKIPVGKAFQAKVATTPVLFPGGGNPGGGRELVETQGCHDITTYPSKNIAAGACMGDGILMDIKNRYQPRVTEVTRDRTNFAFWHSATWNNNGTKVVFTDELGGGTQATCNPSVGPKRGANGIYNVRDGELRFQSYYKIPRTQTNEENCVAHNGSLIPVKGRDIMVQAWYQGGISVVDFTDSRNPRELAWFDRGPIDPPGTQPFPVATLGGSWSAYWHNGRVFSNDIFKGFDVLDVDVPAVRNAKRVRQFLNNPQSQQRYVSN